MKELLVVEVTVAKKQKYIAEQGDKSPAFEDSMTGKNRHLMDGFTVTGNILEDQIVEVGNSLILLIEQ